MQLQKNKELNKALQTWNIVEIKISFCEKIHLFQARTVKYFVKNWIILTSDKEVLETATWMPTNLRSLPQINITKTHLAKKETYFLGKYLMADLDLY